MPHQHRNDPKYGIVRTTTGTGSGTTGNGDLGTNQWHSPDGYRPPFHRGDGAFAEYRFRWADVIGYKDDGETFPNSMIVFHEYEKAPLIFEVRGLPEKS